MKPEWIHGSHPKYTSNGEVVVRGKCAFCGDIVTFRKVGSEYTNLRTGITIAIKCEGCQAIQVYSFEQGRIYPESLIEGVKNLPKEIDKYYQEALRCISHDCPNGAATLFRKLIHQLGIHYGVSKKGDSTPLNETINLLHKNGHIPEKLRVALLGVKDIGNDGAHVNENEPDLEQVLSLKQIIDSVLGSSILTDATLEKIKQVHSNPKNS